MARCDAFVQLALGTMIDFGSSPQSTCETARGPGGLGEDGCSASRGPTAGDAPRAFPSGPRPCSARAAAPREPSRGTPWSGVAGEICAPPRGGNFALSCAQFAVSPDWRPAELQPEDSYIWRHAVCASHGCKPARLHRFLSPRAPHAAHRPGSPHCSHCQSSATRHPLRT